MANQEQLEILKQGVGIWNKWRWAHPEIQIDLGGIDIVELNLPEAFFGYELQGANFRDAYLRGANLFKVNLSDADLSHADLREVNLSDSLLNGINLRNANLGRAKIMGSAINMSDFLGANLSEANLSRSYLQGCNLNGANLYGADLSSVDLKGASLIRTKVKHARVSGSSVYGINVWDLEGDFEDQKDLAITPGESTPIITVDNIKIAQFIYLILNNEEIREVINTLTSKSVLILGRFSIPARKSILDALRNKLRDYDLLPIVFDFDRPTDKDFTETIKILAGLSYFVIADVTNPKSSPLELQATIPDYQIPFVPIVQEGESPFAMMVDLQKKYNWVLNTVSYDSEKTLMNVLKPLIIDPAMKKRQELRLIKAQEPEIISGKEYLAKGKE